MKFFLFIFILIVLVSCHGISKILKSPDPQYKLRMAEKYYVKKKYSYAQQLYEDVMPFFKTEKEFEDIYYKYAYSAYYLKDYLNAENLFKSYLEVFPNSSRAEEIDFMRAFTFYKQSPKAELDQTNTIKAMGLMQTFINTHPGSSRNKEASDIIDVCRQKLEAKDSRSAQLYYDIGQYRAAAVSFNTLLDTYPDTQKADEYKLMSIKSYYKFAELSIEEKKAERFEKVIDECTDFMDRFPQSKFSKEVEHYLSLSRDNLKNFTNEQVKTSS
ncbi:MAG: outer membrane protein assembly factor BamD [Chitinophagaceae bacterium]|nr:outer membrane protein assembly factor BamD [Chitinophagaceae bacterium]